MGLIVNISFNSEFKEWQVYVGGDVGVNLSGFYRTKDAAISAVKMIRSDIADSKVYIFECGKREEFREIY